MDDKGRLLNTGSSNSQLECPDYYDFCDEFDARCPNDCNGRGLCTTNQACFCYTGFGGNDCSGDIALNYSLLTSTNYFGAVKTSQAITFAALVVSMIAGLLTF